MPLPPKDPGNIYWPLPPDYGTLDAAGQREARVDLCRSWFDPARPTKLITDPEAFYVAFHFWKAQYRKKHPGNSAKYSYPDAPMHREWIRRVAERRRNVFTCFRDSGKTFVLGEELPEFIIATRPNTVVIYLTSAQDLAEKQIQAVREDLETNQRLVEDFGAFRRRGSIWRKEHIQTAIRSSLKGISFQERQRGLTDMSLRPLLVIMDDFEVDHRSKNPALRSDTEDYLFNVLFFIPEPGAWFVWTNTLVSINAWAVKATRKLDSRFTSWGTGQWDKYYIDKDGERRSSWPERFPLSTIDAMAGDGSEEIVGVGMAAFMQEAMNQPGSKYQNAFEFSPERNTYHWEMEGERKFLVDHASGQRLDYQELKERSVGIVGTDLAIGKGKRSCYAAINAARIDDQNCIWVLEPWQARTQPMETLYHAIGMAEFWECLAIAVERIAFEDVAIGLLDDEIWRRRAEGRYAPEVLPLNHAGARSKEDRALVLQFRFRDGKIKLPVQGPHNLSFVNPLACESLEEQVRLFTPDRGSLAYMDAIDALVAVHEAFEKIGHVQYNPKKLKGLLDMMRAARQEGLVYWPGASRVNAREIADQVLRERQGPSEAPWSVFSEDGHIFEADESAALFDLEG